MLENSIARRTRFSSLAGLAAVALMLSGCSTAGGDEGGGFSVPVDATEEEWQAAFADVEPLTFVYQVASGQMTPQGEGVEWFKERVETYSDGVITIETAYSNAIVPANDADEALADGRLDGFLVQAALQPSDFPVTGQLAAELSLARPAGTIAGGLAGHAAFTDVLLGTPEFQAEWTDLGLTPIVPLTAPWEAVIACAEPVSTLDDLRGLQIRAGTQSAFNQIEALGATPVSVPFSDLFESVQRGLVDCVSAQPGTLLGVGLTEFVPHLIAPLGDATALSIVSGTEVAGVSWEGFPLQARQLIFDSLHLMAIYGVDASAIDAASQAQEVAVGAGGGFSAFAPDVNDALREYNDSVRAAWLDSELVDGADLSERLDAALTTWTGVLEELGYPDGEVADFANWPGTTYDFTAFTERFSAEVIAAHRPS